MPFANPKPFHVPGFSEAVMIPFIHRPTEFATLHTRPRPEDQIYSWHHKDLPMGYHFHIASLKVLARKHRCPFQTVRLTENEAAGAIRHSNVERHHVQRLLTDPTYARFLEEPGLLVELPPDVVPEGAKGMADPVQMVDGNHRLVARFLRKDREMKLYRIPEPIWKLALLDFPTEIAKGFLLPLPT